MPAGHDDHGAAYARFSEDTGAGFVAIASLRGWNSRKIVILSEAPHRLFRLPQRLGAESKDLGDAYLFDAVRSFRPPKPENRILPAVRTRWSRVHLSCTVTCQFSFSAVGKTVAEPPGAGFGG